MAKKKLLILTTRVLHNGPRMIREMEYLQHQFNVIVMGTTPPPTQFNVQYVNSNIFVTLTNWRINNLLRKAYNKGFIKTANFYCNKLQKYLLQQKFDVIINHEPHLLGIVNAVKQKTGCYTVFNAHEYYPLEFENEPNWINQYGNYYTSLYKQFLPSLSLLINVCNGISNACYTNFGKQSFVLPNVSTRANMQVIPTTVKPIKCIFHGGINPSRQIEKMVELMQLLGSSFTLDIMAVVSTAHTTYYNTLVQLIQNVPNVQFIPPVPFSNIVSTLNKYDIGLFYLAPLNFNNKHLLPNKLFEYIQANLMVAITPVPEMKAYVEKYNLGIVAPDFDVNSLAIALKNSSIADVNKFKANTYAAAQIEHTDKYYLEYVALLKGL